jgi:hypothetical protein
MPYDVILLGAVIGFVVIAVFILVLYQFNSSGFEDRDTKIKQIAQHLGSSLTYETLTKRCPECTNIDYYRAKKYIQ